MRGVPLLKRVVAEESSLYFSGLRLESALLSLFKDNPRLLKLDQVAQTQANIVSNHFMHLAKFFRQMAREEAQMV